MIVCLWENLVFCGCWNHKCTVRAWLVLRLMGLKVFLESPIIFSVSKQGSVETAGVFIPCCYFSTPLEQPQSAGLGFRKCWWYTFGFYWFSLPWSVRGVLSWTCACHWQSLTDGPVGLGFACEGFPLLGACWAHFFLAEGLGWAAGLFYFLFLTSPLLFSLAVIKRVVTSWFLNGLFEGWSVLPLVETYSHPRTCYYCFKAVILKFCRSSECPAVINSEIWIMTKIQITNRMVKKTW